MKYSRVIAHKKLLFGLSLHFEDDSLLFFLWLSQKLSVSVSYEVVSYMRDSTLPKNDHSTTCEYWRHFEHYMYMYVLSAGKVVSLYAKYEHNSLNCQNTTDLVHFFSNIHPLQFSSITCS